VFTRAPRRFQGLRNGTCTSTNSAIARCAFRDLLRSQNHSRSLTKEEIADVRHEPPFLLTQNTDEYYICFATQLTRENLPPQVAQRVARELRKLVLQPLDGIRYLPQDEEQLSEIHAEIRGPEDTPYEGGFFTVKLTLTESFPQQPPRGVFLTKIFHPNVSQPAGEICVNTLKKDWKPTLGLAHVLQVVRCLLIVPFPESSLNDEAGKLFLDSYDEYARRAKLWTKIHAPKRSAVASEEAGETSGEEDKKDSKSAADKSISEKMLKRPAEDAASEESAALATPMKKRTKTDSGPVDASLKKKKTNKKKGIKRL
jgi:ubiquitin-conjugating enzyme E2 S